jgi:uncharacterized membrane-anchored protein
MLQRMQSLWLFLASAISFLTLSSSVSFYSGNKLVNNVTTFVPLYATQNMLILILTIIVAAAALVIIFLYKDRKMQLKLTVAVLAASLLWLFLYYLQTQNFIVGQGRLDLTAIAYFAVPIFLILAARGIWKDEQLVKSVDRLR